MLILIIDGGLLWFRFHRLFELSVDPHVSVADMKRDGWEVDGDGVEVEAEVVCLGGGTIDRVC